LLLSFFETARCCNWSLADRKRQLLKKEDFSF